LSQTFYPLKEVPTRGGNFGFVCTPLTSSEVWNFKRGLKSFLEDPHEVADQFEQFLDLKIYTCEEFMSIMGILFSGEERIMIRRAAMVIWEREHATPSPCPELTELIENSFLRTLLGITMIPMTGEKWGM
jgi:hypothetical protein